MSEKKKLVKLYYDACGGEAAFLRDLRQLARNTYVWGAIFADALLTPYFRRCNLPRVFGYCSEATPPFIVLTGGEITLPLDILDF